jgi:hypothetical protein
MSTEAWFFAAQLGLHLGIYQYCLHQNRTLIHKAPDYQQELGIGISLLSMAYLFIMEIGEDSSSASSGLLMILGYKMLHLVLGLVAYFLTDWKIAGLRKVDPDSFVASAEAEVLNKSIVEIQKAMTLLNTSLTSHHNWMVRSEGAMKSVASIKTETEEAVQKTQKMNEGLSQAISQQRAFQASTQKIASELKEHATSAVTFIHTSTQKITSELNDSISSLREGVEGLHEGLEGISQNLSEVESGVESLNSTLDSRLEKKLEEFDAGISSSLTQAANHLSSNLASAAEHVAGTYVRDMDAVSKVLNDKINRVKEEA